MTPRRAVMSAQGSRRQAACWGTSFLSDPTLLRLAASSHLPSGGGGVGGSDKLYLIRDSHQPHPKRFF